MNSFYVVLNPNLFYQFIENKQLKTKLITHRLENLTHLSISGNELEEINLQGLKRLE